MRVMSMKYDEAIAILNSGIPGEFKSGFAAYRSAWTSDPIKAREAVVLWEGVPALNCFVTADRDLWRTDRNCVPNYRPNDEDKRANDWRVCELWG
jgi:hypothetical protein